MQEVSTSYRDSLLVVTCLLLLLCCSEVSWIRNELHAVRYDSLTCIYSNFLLLVCLFLEFGGLNLESHISPPPKKRTLPMIDIPSPFVLVFNFDFFREGLMYHRLTCNSLYS